MIEHKKTLKCCVPHRITANKMIELTVLFRSKNWKFKKSISSRTIDHAFNNCTATFRLNTSLFAYSEI